MSFIVAAKDNKPLQIRPSRQLLNQLDALAKRHKRASANKLVVEIIEDTIDIWAGAAQAFDDALIQQLERAKGLKEEMLSLPIRPAEIEPATKPNAQGKKGRK